MPTTIPHQSWILRYDSTNDVIGKFHASSGSMQVPNGIVNSPNTSVESVADLDRHVVDHSALSESEKDALSNIYPIIENPPEYDRTFNKIQTAVENYGAYWVYERLKGNRPSGMPNPLQNNSTVPNRDSNGMPAEQAVDDWMTAYESRESL